MEDWLFITISGVSGVILGSIGIGVMMSLRKDSAIRVADSAPRST